MRQFLHLEFEDLHQGSRLRLLRFIAALAVAMAAAALPVTSPAPLAASAVADCAAILDRSARLQCFTAVPEIIAKVGRVVDGDTLDICIGANCIRVRLCGIDAPERGEPGGAEATQALRTLVARESVRCVPVGQGTVCDDCSRATNRGRIVAQCFLGEVAIALVTGAVL